MKTQLLLITFGTIIGALLSFFATMLSSWRERKHAKLLKKEDKENEIIGATLKFLFKSDEITNDLLADRELLEKSKKEFPGKTSFLEQQMFKRLHGNITNDFFNELKFHSFQLKRLENQTIWRDFENLMNAFEEVTKLLSELQPLEKCKSSDIKYKNIEKDFVNKCIDLTKVDKNI